MDTRSQTMAYRSPVGLRGGRDLERPEPEPRGAPRASRLLERLKAFVASAQETDTFQTSHGEAVVTGKAVECAEALGRLKTLRTAAGVGGGAAGGGALLLLLGIL